MVIFNIVRLVACCRWTPPWWWRSLKEPHSSWRGPTKRCTHASGNDNELTFFVYRPGTLIGIWKTNLILCIAWLVGLVARLITHLTTVVYILIYHCSSCCSGGVGERPGLARILQKGIGLYLCSAMLMWRGGRYETILLEGVGLFLCSDARERKIEMLDQGWGHSSRIRNFRF